MKEERLSTSSQGFVWFGAAVAITEIMTGTYLAPLGFWRGVVAILVGHLIGGLLFFFAGHISARKEKNSMETVAISFGRLGPIFFGLLNVIQLIGWTAIMIKTGALAAQVLSKGIWWGESSIFWVIVLTILIMVWISLGSKRLGQLSYIAVGGLFLLTLFLAHSVFGNMQVNISDSTMSFGAGVELGVAMPLSWLPLIGDYTSQAIFPKKSAKVSAIVYFIASSWMYTIGLGMQLFTGESDPALMMMQAGIGLVGIMIVILSTVTTTFLDANSAGISSVAIFHKGNQRIIGVGAALLGMILALLFNVESFEAFLYIIGSVFTPMITVMIMDTYVFHENHEKSFWNLKNSLLWLMGFVIYRVFLNIDTPVGTTLPVVICIAILCTLVHQLQALAVKDKGASTF